MFWRKTGNHDSQNFWQVYMEVSEYINWFKEMVKTNKNVIGLAPIITRTSNKFTRKPATKLIISHNYQECVIWNYTTKFVFNFKYVVSWHHLTVGQCCLRIFTLINHYWTMPYMRLCIPWFRVWCRRQTGCRLHGIPASGIRFQI